MYDLSIVSCAKYTYHIQHTCIGIERPLDEHIASTNVYIYMCVGVCVCIHLYMHMYVWYVYMYICIHTEIFRPLKSFKAVLVKMPNLFQLLLEKSVRFYRK